MGTLHDHKILSGLHTALGANPKAMAKWQSLTPIGRRDFTSWINAAKRAETRRRRIEKTCDMLVSGKRRPCCYAIVPMDLYKALNANQKAKNKWRGLTPDARRDMVDWIDLAKDTETYKRRANQACLRLAAGKRYLPV